MQESTAVSERFAALKTVYNKLHFVGIKIEEQGKKIIIHQSIHTFRLRLFSMDCAPLPFKARKLENSWLSREPADLHFPVATCLEKRGNI